MHTRPTAQTVTILAISIPFAGSPALTIALWRMTGGMARVIAQQQNPSDVPQHGTEVGHDARERPRADDEGGSHGERHRNVLRDPERVLEDDEARPRHEREGEKEVDAHERLDGDARGAGKHGDHHGFHLGPEAEGADDAEGDGDERREVKTPWTPPGGNACGAPRACPPGRQRG